MMYRLGSIAFLVFFFASSTVMFILALLIRGLTGFFDRRLVILHWFSCLWASMYVWIMPAWSMTVHGRENIDRKATYVVVSNHQSMVDILAGFRLFFHFKWVAKVELLKVPFVGWNMVLNRYVILKRGDRKSIIEMMKESEAHLKQGSSVYIYPEGTRSETGEMSPFKSGAFALAKKTGMPILPIAISGTRDALPKNSLTIRGRHRIHVYVLNPIPADRVAALGASELAELAQVRIQQALDRGAIS